MLRYINKIECCNSIHLSQVITYPEQRIAYATGYIPFAVVPTVGLASLSTEEDVSNGTRTHKTVLKATLCSALEQNESEILVFRLTDVEGRQYLLGSNERPFPLVTHSMSCPDKSSERSVITLTVEMQSNIPLFEIVDSK